MIPRFVMYMCVCPFMCKFMHAHVHDEKKKEIDRDCVICFCFPAQFKDKFEDTFTGDKVQIPWYLVSGNHDYYGGDEGIAAEIAYSNKSTRWNMPSFYYDKLLTGKDGVSVHLVGIDTWRINGGAIRIVAVYVYVSVSVYVYLVYILMYVYVNMYVTLQNFPLDDMMV
jgi:hypothetical protein